MIVEINKDALEISVNYQCMCLKAGGSFRKGCPNYGKKAGCPPRNLFNEDYNLDEPLYLIATDFELTLHAKKLEKRIRIGRKKQYTTLDIGKRLRENYMK